MLTLAAGLGAAEAVGLVTGRRPDVKWPNDLLMDGRKIAGLLSEMEVRDHRVLFVILGLGLNVNLPLEDLPADLADSAGSLLTVTGRSWDRVLVLAALLECIEKDYLALTEGRLDELLERYRRVCLTLGRAVRVALGSTVIKGTAVDVDQKGRLVIEDEADGRLVRVNAGEVTLAESWPEQE